jgi:hypothetical protein
MKKLTIAIALISSTVMADPRYYTEYKNTMGFIDTDYVHNSSVNDLRLGVKFDNNMYIEAGASERDGNIGTGFEAGYKFKFDAFEVKGKVEDRQMDHIGSGTWVGKIETEVRYYFN